jgi:SsrA-binding protein
VRKLLLHNHEIKQLYGKMNERGYSLIPLRLYFRGGKVKLLLALAKGKKQYDKRDSIRQREHKRDLDRHRKEYK